MESLGLKGKTRQGYMVIKEPALATSKQPLGQDIVTSSVYMYPLGSLCRGGEHGMGWMHKTGHKVPWQSSAMRLSRRERPDFHSRFS